MIEVNKLLRLQKIVNTLNDLRSELAEISDELNGHYLTFDREIELTTRASNIMITFSNIDKILER